MNSLKTVIQIAPADKNQGCLADLFNKLMDLFRRNVKIELSFGGQGLSPIYDAAGEIPNELGNIVQFQRDEFGRLTDIKYNFGSTDVSFFQPLGCALYRKQGDVGLPWIQVSGAPTISDGTDTWVLCEYTLPPSVAP